MDQSVTNHKPQDLSDQDFKALLTSLNSAVLVSVTDNQGNIVYVNDKFVEVTKYSKEELIGQNHRILKSGHHPAEMFVDLWKTISSGKIWQGEIKNKAKDGTYFWVDTSISPVLGENGKPERYVAVRLLSTDKKNYEDQLKSQNTQLIDANSAMVKALDDIDAEKKNATGLASDLEKFKLAVDSASDHIVITDSEGKIMYANKAVEKTTGFSIDEVLYKKAGSKDLWGGLMDEKYYKDMWQVLKKDKKSFSGEIKNKKKDGTFYFANTTISPVLDKNGDVGFFVGIERDITKEKEVDIAKTEFVSLASHQLRTPLTAINWYTELMSSDTSSPLTDKQKEYLNEISIGSKRMSDLVGALLNVSRIELGTFAVDPEPTDLVKLVQSVIDELAPLIKEKNLNVIINSETIPLDPSGGTAANTGYTVEVDSNNMVTVAAPDAENSATIQVSR